MSPARIGGNLPHHPRSHQPPPSLQGIDFPPLSSGPVPEKKPPVVAGAWTNASSVRSALRAGPSGSINSPATGSALVHYPNSHGGTRGPSPNTCHLDEQDRAFDRPPAKNGTEPFNPKGGRPQAANGMGVAEEGSTPDDLADRVEGLTLAANSEMLFTASPPPAMPSSDPQ
ncbi:uncharacterized protein PHACADRAFT_264501 [Phanerochaete carnosa HHB-10118-sp]|uniref:Uncharacterized protein n=1 Tax=Phanerochaete carnosa (strain HHB-10118-sp) TaxID=650164 RepID=K5VFR7_PHACS|nr:uncharacterized protein PHACADRAFT_264501 [Phanerochaete carnosa HHB-10118-sp]EKM50018.1 hypothetical protein PHACADRAFT_264501 [Phanerochaete carnosa HHB-10118-sp]